MDKLIEAAITFRDQRVVSIENEKIKNKENEDNKNILLKQNKLKNGKYCALSDDDLNKYGENIVEEYELVKVSSNEAFFGRGISYRLMNVYMRDHVTNLGGAHKPKEIKVEKDRNNNLNIGDNCKIQYYACINKIKSFGISIYSVSKMLDKYFNGKVSCVMGGCDCFVFKCIKNNYNFTVTFDDDADCEPGILRVSNVKNIDTKEDIKIYCDLYCQNTGEDKLYQFLDIINNNTEFYDKTFGHFLKLPALLESDGIKFEVVNKCENKYDVNNYDITFYITISWYDVVLVLYPYKCNDVYELYVTTLENFKDGKNAYHIKNYLLNYHNVDDYKFVVKNLGLYVEHLNGNHGYYENGKYWNDKDISDNYDKKYKPLQYFTMQFTNKIFDGLQFDTLIVCCNGNKYVSIKGEYNIDEYYVRFWHDKNVDENKCFLMIKGAYCDFGKLYNDYNDNDKKVIMNLINIGDELLFEGSFYELFGIMNEFLDKLVGVYPIKEVIKDTNEWISGTFE